MDLDIWDCFEKGRIPSYTRRNTVSQFSVMCWFGTKARGPDESEYLKIILILLKMISVRAFLLSYLEMSCRGVRNYIFMEK